MKRRLFHVQITRYRKKIQSLHAWIMTFALFNGVLFTLLGLPYLKVILSYGSLFKNKLFDFSGFLGKSSILFFSILNYTSHFFLLALLISLVLIFLSIVFPFKRLVITSGVVIYVFGIMLLLIDEYIFLTYHFHLNRTIISFVLSSAVVRTFDLSVFEVLGASVLLSLLVLIEIGGAWLAYYLLKYAIKIKKYLLCLLCAWLISIIILLVSMTQKVNLLSQQISNLPLYHQVLMTILPGESVRRHLYNFSENYYSEPSWENRGETFHYPLSPMQCDTSDKNIILIMVDALRFDVLKKDLMPELSRFSAHSLVFDKHISGGNATQSGLFSLFYSLPENYWTAALHSSTPPVLHTVLKQFGYDRKVIWSPDMTIPPFHQTIYKGISPLRLSHQRGDMPAEWDKATTKDAISYLNQKAKTKQPFYLNVFYRTTHAYCQNNSIPAPHQPVIQYCSRLLLNQSTDVKPLYNRYKNAVEFIDKELGQLLMVIKQKGLLDNSIVIITSDHGEEFNDTGEGYFGHAGNFSDYQLQVPMIVSWPGKKAKHIQYRTSHYDVVPTLMRELFSCKTPFTSYSVGKNMFDSTSKETMTLVGSYAFMGWVTPNSITVLRKSGEISLQDKNTRPLVNAVPDKTALKKALVMMRRYYHHRKND